MRPLSASEAISPAIERTKFVLFRPFRKGRTWKLSATAYMTSMGCMFLPIPLAILILPWMTAPEGMSRAAFVALFACIVVFETAFVWLFFYFGARLEFVLFDIVLFKAEFVSPVWRKYERHTWPWIGLKVVVGTALSLVAGLPLTAWFLHSFRLFTVLAGQPPSPEFVRGIFLESFLAMGWFSFLFLFSSLLGNFVLPSLALENTSIGDAMRRLMAMIQQEPGQIFLFCLFKVLLGIAAFIALEIATLMVELVGAIPLCIVAFLGWFVLHQLGAAGTLMMAAGAVLLYLAFAAFIFYIIIGMQGCILTFFQAYAMYFLGGRYPLLGNLMDEFAPQPYLYPPSFSPPAMPPLEPPAPSSGY